MLTDNQVWLRVKDIALIKDLVQSISVFVEGESPLLPPQILA